MNPLVPPAVIGAVGSVISGLFGKSSAKDQMDFQREMYGQRYQLTMEDMRKAGLNPILAYKQGAPGAPQGAGWQMPNIGASALAGMNTGLAVERQNTLLDAELKKIVEDARKTGHEADINSVKASIAENLEGLLEEIMPDAVDTYRALLQSGTNAVEAFREITGKASKALEELERWFKNPKPRTTPLPQSPFGTGSPEAGMVN